MTSLRFVHAADLHLDSPLRGLEQYPGAPIDAIRGATRRATENLVELCLTEDVQLVVIAGDLYDGDWRDYGTGLFFLEQLGRLTRAGIRVVWVRGNHDAASQITRRLRAPEGAYELGTHAPESRLFEDLGVAVHGQSYAERDVSEDLAARYPEPLPGWFNLGLLHTALDGREGHAPYAPCTVDRLRAKGYDYWALGHVHRREVVSQDPWIVFSGNLQGRHARETGAKGATLVHVEDRVVTAVEHRSLDVVRWDDLSVELDTHETLHHVLEALQHELTQATERAQERLLAARVRLRGRTPIYTELLRRRTHLEQEIRGLAVGFATPVWIEKLSFEAAPTIEPQQSLAPEDPVLGLLRAIEDAPSDPELMREIVHSLSPLAQRLPAEYRAQRDAIDFDDPQSLTQLFREIPDEILPLLLELRARG